MALRNQDTIIFSFHLKLDENFLSCFCLGRGEGGGPSVRLGMKNCHSGREGWGQGALMSGSSS